MPTTPNILSIDLESWVHFYRDALRIHSPMTSEEKKTLDNNYVPMMVDQLLTLLQKYDQTATFFIVAEIYDWYPETIEKIMHYGHEIGYHTHSHIKLVSEDVLAQELKKSAVFIERCAPKGFRAPFIYLTRPALKLLAQYGFMYSSSTYGEYAVSRIDGIDEIPVSAVSYWWRQKKKPVFPEPLTVGSLVRQLPFGSGFMIALLGGRTSFFIARVNKKNMPAVIFVHPWQLYQPKELANILFRINVSISNPLCIPYMRNILKPFEKILQTHRFISFREYYGQPAILG